MEFFNNIIQTLTTPNEWMTNLICSPLIIVEMYVSMLLFTTILDIKCTFKQKVIYSILTTFICIITRFVLPAPYGTIINIIIEI